MWCSFVRVRCCTLEKFLRLDLGNFQLQTKGERLVRHIDYVLIGEEVFLHVLTCFYMLLVQIC